MKIQTFSILVGGMACNAHCPFCVSKMTPNALSTKAPQINWRNFDLACRLADRAGATTVMLTGKGEPTLYLNTVYDYLNRLSSQKQFPLIELQTNGLSIVSGIKGNSRLHLSKWYELGLSTIALSVVHWDATRNAEIYCPGNAHYPIKDMVEFLHSIGFSVRLSCILIKGYIDDAARMRQMIEFARHVGAEQLTFIPVNAPTNTTNPNIANWANEHKLADEEIALLKNDLDASGDLLMELAHGACVYDVGGQNVCLSNCLKRDTILADKTIMRNLIFHPDGHLRYDWNHQGSIIL